MIQGFKYTGIPKPQPRQRHRYVPGKNGKKGFVMNYQPTDAALYKDNIAAQITAQKPVFIPQGVPVHLRLAFYLPRPKAHYNSKGRVKDRYENAEPTGKPDLDNLEKAIMDAMKGVVWHDDAQVTASNKVKAYNADPDTGPYVLIQVQTEDDKALTGARKRGWI